MNYNKGVENMYKRDKHYNEKISTEDLYKELDTHYNAETDLVRNLMSMSITEGLVETRHELSCANEELWSLNDWPEDQGFQSSDRAEYLRRIKETIAFERKFLQAENELVQINKLTECPKNDTVRKYMTMNDKIAEGMVA
jgi:glucuronate isomerase